YNSPNEARSLRGPRAFAIRVVRTRAGTGGPQRLQCESDSHVWRERSIDRRRAVRELTMRGIIKTSGRKQSRWLKGKPPWTRVYRLLQRRCWKSETFASRLDRSKY